MLVCWIISHDDLLFRSSFLEYYREASQNQYLRWFLFFFRIKIDKIKKLFRLDFEGGSLEKSVSCQAHCYMSYGESGQRH